MPSDRATEMLDRLRSSGGRVTRSRELVVDVLVGGAHHHVTAPEVVEAVRAIDPDFHESTVYRTLDRLTDLGLVTRIEAAGGPAVFHLPEQAHHHLVCDRCGATVGTDPALLADVAARLARDHGFVLRPEAVTLPGRCADCVEIAGPDASAPVLDPVPPVPQAPPIDRHRHDR